MATVDATDHFRELCDVEEVLLNTSDMLYTMMHTNICMSMSGNGIAHLLDNSGNSGLAKSMMISYKEIYVQTNNIVTYQLMSFQIMLTIAANANPLQTVLVCSSEFIKLVLDLLNTLLHSAVHSTKGYVDKQQ